MTLSYGSQRTTRWSPFAPAALWILGIELPDLVVDAFALYSISPALTSFPRQGASLIQLDRLATEPVSAFLGL